MSQTDCGVFPARAEGWNLELLEMMACGKHVIATNYSAHTQFCSSSNCNLIEIDNLETAYDGVFFLGDKGLWAELANPQKDQIITHMKNIHRTKQTGGLPINNAGVDTAKKFSWENSAKEVCNGLV
jgi:glycosyltransferase involved in cell wall biosynthesis